MSLVVGFAGRFEVQVVTGHERGVTGGHDIAARDPEVVTGQQRGHVSAEGAADCAGQMVGIEVCSLAAGEGAALLAIVDRVGAAQGFPGFDRQVAPGQGFQCALGAADVGGSGVEVLAGSGVGAVEAAG